MLPHPLHEGVVNGLGSLLRVLPQTLLVGVQPVLQVRRDYMLLLTDHGLLQKNVLRTLDKYRAGTGEQVLWCLHILYNTVTNLPGEALGDPAGIKHEGW